MTILVKRYGFSFIPLVFFLACGNCLANSNEYSLVADFIQLIGKIEFGAEDNDKNYLYLLDILSTEEQKRLRNLGVTGDNLLYLEKIWKVRQVLLNDQKPIILPDFDDKKSLRIPIVITINRNEEIFQDDCSGNKPITYKKGDQVYKEVVELELVQENSGGANTDEAKNPWRIASIGSLVYLPYTEIYIQKDSIGEQERMTAESDLARISSSSIPGFISATCEAQTNDFVDKIQDATVSLWTNAGDSPLKWKNEKIIGADQNNNVPESDLRTLCTGTQIRGFDHGRNVPEEYFYVLTSLHCLFGEVDSKWPPDNTKYKFDATKHSLVIKWNYKETECNSMKAVKPEKLPQSFDIELVTTYRENDTALLKVKAPDYAGTYVSLGWQLGSNVKTAYRVSHPDGLIQSYTQHKLLNQLERSDLIKFDKHNNYDSNLINDAKYLISERARGQEKIIDVMSGSALVTQDLTVIGQFHGDGCTGSGTKCDIWVDSNLSCSWDVLKPFLGE
jgi:hypothetical protein